MYTPTLIGMVTLAVARGQIMFPDERSTYNPKPLGGNTNINLGRQVNRGDSSQNPPTAFAPAAGGNFGDNTVADYSVNVTDCNPVTHLCNNITYYPSYAINKALSRMNKYTRSIVKSLAKPNLARNDITIRFGGGDDRGLDTNVCATKKERITPRGALNTDGEFKWILNSPDGKEEYVQSVDTTLCLNANNPCMSGQFSSYETYCKQEYSEHKLLALDKDAAEIIIDNFRFPSCCTCQVSKTLEF